MSKISGFTIVRNAEKLEYPFRESVLSILPFVDELVINCGDSEDGTRALCEALAAEHPKITLMHSVWAREGQSGGYQLKAQSDAALARCRGDWCLYLQADEVLHEEDFPRLREAMEKADRRPEVDGLVFEYLHFYSNYDYVIRGRSWYRREVRLFKNGRGIESYRDAQGFRKKGERLKGILTGARVFHYGHVRTPKAMSTKLVEMSRWWGETPHDDPERLKPVRHVGIRRFRDSHPSVMADRLAHNGEYVNPATCPRRFNAKEFQNLVTLWWEAIFRVRLWEFRNYDLI